MGNCTSTKETRLTGDWTISGVVHQVDRLMNFSFFQDKSESEKILEVDCSAIERIDMTGLQLLYAWLQCAKIRGRQPRLVNIPDGIRESLKHIGFHSVFTENS